jgi:hypothetical protein
MDNVHISTHFFFVPNRLVWNNWERFNGEQDNPGDSTDYNIPLIAVTMKVLFFFLFLTLVFQILLILLFLV